jgi:hypothetical protein
MRPSISALIKPLYPALVNGPNVQNYPMIYGMGRNLYFVDHMYLDETNPAIQSKFNRFEGDFIANLVRYLIVSGNKPEDITILALYAAQLLYIRPLLIASKTAGVKLTTVDNY